MLRLLAPRLYGFSRIRLQVEIMLYRFRHRILGPLVILWLVLTIASVVKLATVWNGLSQALHASTEAATISEALNKVYADLQLAESSQTSYLLTGSTNFFDSFVQAEKAKNENFSHLATLIGNDRTLQSDLSELRGLVESKMSEMKETVRLRHEKNLNEAAKFATSIKSKDEMDNIQLVEQRMRERRLNLISNAGEAMQRRFQQGQFFGLLTGAIGVGAGLFALFLIWESYRQMQSQQQLLEDKLRAEETVVEKSAFLANMSHEIRTPMNAILGFGELLEQEPLTPRQAQYARSIRQSGKSLLQLINDVLDLSKMEAGKMELFLEPTDVREVCGFLQTMFAQQAAAKSIRLELDIGPAPRSLLLDRLRLRQVLVNLVGNAVKFTEQGAVNVRVNWLPGEQDRGRGILAFDVSDTGVGISREKQAEIFKPFVQSEPGRAAENQGSGLGLSIVQRLLEMMGGTITLDSAVGHGSVFHLRLADISVSARLPVSDAAEEERAVNFNDFKPATLMVVDDNETNLQLLTGMFERTHHQLVTAANGKTAIEKIAGQKPDILLLDLRMAGMDGNATLAEIRKIPGLELLPVIALTASAQAADEPEAHQRFNGFIRKPFSRAALYRELTGFLPRIVVQHETPNGAPARAAAPEWAGGANNAAAKHHLGEELRALRANEWPALRETLAIRDSHLFAQKLRSLAQATPCARLSSYADVLAAHAETYSVTELEKHLADFPELVETIAKNGSG